jgi:hypothetical protein
MSHFLKRTWSLVKAYRGPGAVQVIRLPSWRLLNLCDASAKSSTVLTVLARDTMSGLPLLPLVEPLSRLDTLLNEALQRFPKLVSPLILFDTISNPNRQDRLVHIESYSGVLLSVEPVLFLTYINRTYGGVYSIVTLIPSTP